MQDSARKFKEEVAEAAISLFKRNGYNNVTVNEICKECGISRSYVSRIEKKALQKLEQALAEFQQ